jgi:hypothetical protein
MANAELEAAASSFYCNNIVPQNGEANNKENNQHIVNLNTSQTVNGNTQIINLFQQRSNSTPSKRSTNEKVQVTKVRFS